MAENRQRNELYKFHEKEPDESVAVAIINNKDKDIQPTKLESGEIYSYVEPRKLIKEVRYCNRPDFMDTYGKNQQAYKLSAGMLLATDPLSSIGAGAEPQIGLQIRQWEDQQLLDLPVIGHIGEDDIPSQKFSINGIFKSLTREAKEETELETQPGRFNLFWVTTDVSAQLTENRFLFFSNNHGRQLTAMATYHLSSAEPINLPNIKWFTFSNLAETMYEEWDSFWEGCSKRLRLALVHHPLDLTLGIGSLKNQFRIKRIQSILKYEVNDPSLNIEHLKKTLEASKEKTEAIAMQERRLMSDFSKGLLSKKELLGALSITDSDVY